MGAKNIAGGVALLGAAAAGLAFWWPGSQPPLPVSELLPHTAAQSPGRQSLDTLPKREALGDVARPPFSAPPAPAASLLHPGAVEATPTARDVTPTPPALPYRVAGQVVHDGRTHIVLASGDAVHVVSEGDSLDGGYRVQAMSPASITLLYEPLGTTTELPLAPIESLAPTAHVAQAQPARLRWEGPERVQAGTTFDVALKLASGEPLRATPLQLNFDAALLEPVKVRAGRYFSGGTFSYRVNPAGSIFVGASGSGGDASDAELVVVSFKSIRGGATAELKLSSVLLQGTAGRAIAYARPVDFRTAIVQ